MRTDDEFRDVAFSARWLTTLVSAIAGSLAFVYGEPLIEKSYGGTSGSGVIVFIPCLIMSAIVAIPSVPRALAAISPRGPYLLTFGVVGAMLGAFANFCLFVLLLLLIGNSFGRSSPEKNLIFLEMLVGPGAFAGFFGGLTTGLFAGVLKRQSGRAKA